ncbi:hypothetical protein RFI_00723 [Reticulomyxa filosa]|uniref:AAA+ ATPase domain-containing protein n=1 Tax=Reticulomyxa filosa TaxID=46433 RepID=X6PE58_RETFI|nr:hypothetical protein RFI_00723 [Reticulomyxa filosa]|eukprot:ETO36339.1 hypothetical protein RFI_00723 [Reticulomyxa filosa]
MTEIMKTCCPKIEQASPLHQTAFYKYLFNQFVPLSDSVFLRNEDEESRQWPLRFKHEVTKSVIAISTDLSCRLYAHNQDDVDESKGEDEFYLCKQWQQSKNFLYLVNQDDAGLSNVFLILKNFNFLSTISTLINDTKLASRHFLRIFHDLGFTLLNWNEEMKARNDSIPTEWKLTKKDNMPKMSAEIEEKHKRTELLFRIVGTKETLKTKIKMELWGMEFMSDEKKEPEMIIENRKDGEFRHYVLTYDNILKMIAIYLRIRSNTPIILMGETGCGKTSLIKCLAKVADISLQAVDVHGGFGREDLRNIVKRCVDKWESDEKKNERDREQWIFLDEINTSPDIGWLNELVCNHTLDGVKIPEGIKIIAACNPYRQRKLSDGEDDGQLVNDELSKYVYRVYPLCETMKEYVWSFGRLSDSDEQQYIAEMTNQVQSEISDELHEDFEKLKSKILEKITITQNFLRTCLKDKIIVSLRDVSRCLKIFEWLMKQHCDELNNEKESPWIDRGLNIAIGLCYYFRLNSEKRQKLSEKLSSADIVFSKLLEQEVDKLCKSFAIPPGVALNQGLKENLFILFMSIMTTTPIVLVGKPGTSKTLSFQIVRNNLHQDKMEFEKRLKKNSLPFAVKPIHTVAFQCTRNSKPQGIKERWDQTMRHSENSQIKPILLLDEIGLAEHSKHSPLKVLHQLLENPKISFVGISNWPLDAAKMNRVIMHQIPPMTTEELKNTALEMLKHYQKNVNSYQGELINGWLEKEIENAIKVYERVINTQAFKSMNKKDFLEPVISIL